MESTKSRPGTRALFSGLCIVAARTNSVLRSLKSLERLNPEPAGFVYVAPPRDENDEGRRASREEMDRCRGAPGLYRGPDAEQELLAATDKHREWNPWYDRYDAYHRAERPWRDGIEAAKRACELAGPELGEGSVPVIERTSTKIRRDLQALSGAVPTTLVVGDHPPRLEDVEENLIGSRLVIEDWVEQLRALLPLQEAEGEHRARREVQLAVVPPRTQPEPAAGNGASNRASKSKAVTRGMVEAAVKVLLDEEQGMQKGMYQARLAAAIRDRYDISISEKAESKLATELLRMGVVEKPGRKLILLGDWSPAFEREYGDPAVLPECVKVSKDTEASGSKF